MYTGNYPGSSSGYDPNLPTGRNKWDEQEFWENRPQLPDEDDYGEEDEYPRKESILSENSFTVINNGSFNCQIYNDGE